MTDWRSNRESFYRELTLRNSDFISDATQRKLRQASILVAGCGSTGGSVVELLVRTGAEHLILADNGTYELNNANRQNMTIADIGEYKVEVFERRCKAINPYCHIEPLTDGITPENVEALAKRADIVIDGVDVTSRPGLKMKYQLHKAAKRHRRPVISGYDMAASQYIAVFDYAREDLAVLGGALTERIVDTLDSLTCCAILVPGAFVPPEMFSEIDRQFRGEKTFVSQLGIAANLFGVAAASLVLDLLEGRPVRDQLYIDVWAIIRPDRPDAATEQKSSLDRERLEAHVRTQLASMSDGSAPDAVVSR